MRDWIYAYAGAPKLRNAITTARASRCFKSTPFCDILRAGWLLTEAWTTLLVLKLAELQVSRTAIQFRAWRRFAK